MAVGARVLDDVLRVSGVRSAGVHAKSIAFLQMKRLVRWAVGILVLSLLLPLAVCLLISATGPLLSAAIIFAAGLIVGLCAPVLLRRRWPFRVARRARFTHARSHQHDRRRAR